MEYFVWGVKNNKGFLSTQFYTLLTLRRVALFWHKYFLYAISVNYSAVIIHIYIQTFYKQSCDIFSTNRRNWALVDYYYIVYFVYNARTTILIISEAIALIITVIIGINTIISFILLTKILKEYSSKFY